MGCSMKLTRPASMNHSEPQFGDTPSANDAGLTTHAQADQFKEPTLRLRRGLFPGVGGIANPCDQNSQRSLETAPRPRPDRPVVHLLHHRVADPADGSLLTAAPYTSAKCAAISRWSTRE